LEEKEGRGEGARLILSSRATFLSIRERKKGRRRKFKTKKEQLPSRRKKKEKKGEGADAPKGHIISYLSFNRKRKERRKSPTRGKGDQLKRKGPD